MGREPSPNEEKRDADRAAAPKMPDEKGCNRLKAAS